MKLQRLQTELSKFLAESGIDPLQRTADGEICSSEFAAWRIAYKQLE